MHLGSVMSCGLDIVGEVDRAGAALRQALADGAAVGASRDRTVLIPPAPSAVPRQEWQAALEASGQAVRRQHTPGGMNARMWRPEAWRTTILLAVSRPGEAMRMINEGERLSALEGVPGKARVWMMLRARALLDLGRLADAAAEADAIFEMSDELGAGNRGYLNDVASWVAGRGALHTGDPRHIENAEAAARRLRRAQLAPSRDLGELLTASLRSLADKPRPTGGLDAAQLCALGSASLTASSPRSHADVIRLIRILIACTRTADAESLVATLEDAAANHPEFPFLAAAALHARALTEADAALAVQAVDLHAKD